ncbi:hypothetical protein GGU11DRAFT_812750 [Lentinula aff. detonsa]|nr:hypothetical protein GGU11DRAFT_812750 [Lentinula aff. detonsa]
MGGVGELDVTEGVEREIVPKVEAPRKKLVTRMTVVGPRNREVISIPKKRHEVIDAEEVGSSRKRRRMIPTSIVVDSDSDSLPLPFPHPCERCVQGDQVYKPQPNAPNAVACDRCHLARQSCSFLQKSKRSRAKTPPSESESVGVKGEMRELRFAIEGLTEQVRALVRQGRRDRAGREGRREDHKRKGRRRETTPKTDRYSSE